MKRYLAVLAAAVFFSAIALGCSSSKSDNKTDEDVNESAEESVTEDETADESVTEMIEEQVVETVEEQATETIEETVVEEEIVEETATESEVAEETAEEEETEAEQAACIDAAGLYLLTGTCNTSSYSLPKYTCVSQDAQCNVKLQNSDGTEFNGKLTGASFDVSTSTAYGEEKCTGTNDSGSFSDLKCTLDAVGLVCDGSADLTGLPNTTKSCCNPMNQSDCGANERCQIVGTGNAADPLIASCIDNTGTGKEGDVCTRPSTNNADIGRDTCGKGLFCTLYGSPDNATRYCKRYCDTDADCAAADGCYKTSGLPPIGNCIKACDPVPADSTECGTGMTCHMMPNNKKELGSYTYFGSCWAAPGTVDIGGDCQYLDDCKQGATCWYGTCLQLCDTNHQCPTGKNCGAINWTRSFIGVCGTN